MPCAYNVGCPNSPDTKHCWHSTHIGAWFSTSPPPMECCWCHTTYPTYGGTFPKPMITLDATNVG